MAHVYYTHKDIDKARQFLEDFGFQEVKRVGRDTYYRGTGSEPFVYCARQGDKDEFGGAAFVLDSEEDLEYASRTLPGAGMVTELTDAPGGGRCVTFRDPVDHFPFHLTYGQRLQDDVKAFPQLKYNFVSLFTS
jgi:catechol 2,3-dioxygenase-like lactoylglutathione lyase family enzyme